MPGSFSSSSSLCSSFLSRLSRSRSSSSSSRVSGSSSRSGSGCGGFGGMSTSTRLSSSCSSSSICSSSSSLFHPTRPTLDKTRAPHKYYKYGYVMDPRKTAPFESMTPNEVRPRVVRPPCAAVPDVDTFLEKADVSARQHLPEHRSIFKGWNDLMTRNYYSMRHAGMPRGAANEIRWTVREYHKGYLPDRFRPREEVAYYAQFKEVKDGTYRMIPELPEKYRPHMQGIEQQPLPDYRAINQVPEWAQKEEARLNEKMNGGAAKGEGGK